MGTWKDPIGPFELTFLSNHTLSFKSPTIAGGGTWKIAGDEFIVTFEHASRPGKDTMHIYSDAKICGDRLHFGPSRMSSRFQDKQLGESESFQGRTVLHRLR